MSKTAVYLRVSSKSQKVLSQKREVQRYLDGHGIDVPDRFWFVDAGVSGKDLERPKLRELNRAVFNGAVDTVVLYKLDRLSRSIYDGITLLHDWIARHGVRVVIVTMQIDLAGALGQTVAALLLGLAQMEREHLRERQAAGIAAAKASCARCSTQKQNVAIVHGVCPQCGGTKVRSWGGRQPGKFSVSRARIRELIERGLNKTEIARIIGVSRRTIIRALNRT